MLTRGSSRSNAGSGLEGAGCSSNWRCLILAAHGFRLALFMALDLARLGFPQIGFLFVRPASLAVPPTWLARFAGPIPQGWGRSRLPKLGGGNGPGNRQCALAAKQSR